MPGPAAAASFSRLCERLVGRYFGSYGAYRYPSNTANAAFAAGTRALKLATGLGLDIDPDSTAQRRSVETAATKAALGRVEDSIDAVVCVHIAGSPTSLPTRYEYWARSVMDTS